MNARVSSSFSTPIGVSEWFPIQTRGGQIGSLVSSHLSLVFVPLPLFSSAFFLLHLFDTPQSWLEGFYDPIIILICIMGYLFRVI